MVCNIITFKPQGLCDTQMPIVFSDVKQTKQTKKQANPLSVHLSVVSERIGQTMSQESSVWMKPISKASLSLSS